MRLPLPSQPPRRFRQRLLVATLAVGLVPVVGFVVLAQLLLKGVFAVSLAPLEATLGDIDAELARPGIDPAVRGKLHQARINLAQAELARQSLRRLAPRALTALLAASVTAILITTLMLGRALSGPVERLALGMSRYARGELGAKLPESPTTAPDELELLVRQLNRMGDELLSQRERLRLTEALSASYELARTVAHELKNPLTAMKMAVGRLANPSRPDEAQQRESLALLEQEIGVLTRLARSFSELARLPAPSPQRLDLGVHLEECCRLYRHDSPVPIECDAPVGLAIVDGDPDQLRRALGNILKNAAEASSPADGPVRVTLGTEGGAAHIVVRDSGVGIAGPLAGAALARPLGSTKAEGSGLGLPIAQKILHDHGGALRLEPAEGRGTRALVTLSTRGRAMSGGPRLLVVDDDPGVLRGVAGLLRDHGYRTLEAGSAAEAWRLLSQPGEAPALVLLDIRMPGESGIELLERLPQPLPLPVVILSGEATIADTVRALKLGATDFIEKPPSPERVLTAVRNALALQELAAERERLCQELAQPGNLVGDSPALEEVRRLVARVGPTDSVVLVTGETGTGKERVARALHLASGRKGRFVAVNCAAIPLTLLESELFGYERGAFSGAVARRIGKIEQAHSGTLLLDEIGDMPQDLQAKLLRVLEQKEVERLGGTSPIAVDARIVASTHRDLRKAVAEGGFREDLYYRLDVFPIAVPPLRQRQGDIVPLVRAFAADLLGTAVAVDITPEAEAALGAYPWPGNVRELRNLVERLSLLRGDGPFKIDAAALTSLRAAPTPRPAGPDLALGVKSYRELVDDCERGILEAALARSRGNIAAAARLLRADRGHIHRRIRALGLSSADE